MNRITPHLVFLTLGILFATCALSATVYIKQPGQFEQCKTVAGSIKYHCVTGTGCKADTLKCVDPAPISLMPIVDVSKNITPTVGWSNLRIRPNMGPQDVPPVGDGKGQFRIDCDVSHMSNDDPILYPRQQSAAHHHTFWGNTSLNFNSDLMNLNQTGNSTCRGGIANRSAYWMPSMVVVGVPQRPDHALWYYKTGYIVPKELIRPPPKGLRMIIGNMKAKTLAESKAISYGCYKYGEPGTPSSSNIPDCKTGWQIFTHIDFPQCWDGKNLDSPDHISHMTYASNDYLAGEFKGCPASHPVALPALTLNVTYNVTQPEGSKNWRVSSDNYKPDGYNAGYSGHADVVFGWDDKVIAGIVKNCLNAGKDCGNHMLGDGTVIYGDRID